MTTLKNWTKPTIDAAAVRSAQTAGTHGLTDGGTVNGKKHTS